MKSYFNKKPIIRLLLLHQNSHEWFKIEITPQIECTKTITEEELCGLKQQKNVQFHEMPDNNYHHKQEMEQKNTINIRRKVGGGRGKKWSSRKEFDWIH